MRLFVLLTNIGCAGAFALSLGCLPFRGFSDVLFVLIEELSVWCLVRFVFCELYMPFCAPTRCNELMFIPLFPIVVFVIFVRLIGSWYLQCGS